MFRGLLGILLFFAALTSCSTFSATDPDPRIRVRTALQQEMEDFSVPNWERRPASLPEAPAGSPFVPPAEQAVGQYRTHLTEGLQWGGGPIWHQMGTLPLSLKKGGTIALGVNVFEPNGPSRGTLMFLHGYMAHAADFSFTLAWFASRGWTVVTLDLPGHGISEGRRADIERFSDYGDAVEVWMRWVFRQDWPGPRVLLAHSLGTAAALEALRRPQALRPDRVIFCAPLLRTDWYPALSLADLLAGWLFTTVGTFGWDGYLDGTSATVHWYGALDIWLSDLERQKPLDLPLVIYSGDKDSVVDEAWNQREYRRLVPAARWVTLQGKDHWFLSSKEDRQAFHESLSTELEDLVTPPRPPE